MSRLNIILFCLIWIGSCTSLKKNNRQLDDNSFNNPKYNDFIKLSYYSSNNYEDSFRKACQEAQRLKLPLLVDINKDIRFSRKQPIIINDSLTIIGGTFILNQGDLFELKNMAYLGLKSTHLSNGRDIIKVRDKNVSYSFLLDSVRVFNCNSFIKTHHFRSNKVGLVEGKILNCVFNKMSDITIAIKEKVISKLIIENSTFNDVTSCAIQVGNGIYNENKLVKNIQINNNIITNIKGEKTSRGIEVAGADSVTIFKNKIQNSNCKLKQNDAAIYVKATNTVIIENNILNAGYYQGAIRCKGVNENNNRDKRITMRRAESFGITVKNNVIEYSIFREYGKGISVHNQNNSIYNNEVINASTGIELIPNGSQDSIKWNYISNNIIKCNHQYNSVKGININGVSNGLSISENKITLNTASNAVGIQIKSELAKNTKIITNEINLKSTGIKSNSYGINFLLGKDSQIFMISHNKISNSSFGISFFPYLSNNIEVDNINLDSNEFEAVTTKLNYSKEKVRIRGDISL